MMSTDLSTSSISPSDRIEQPNDRPDVGSWWWIKGTHERDDYDRAGKQWLGCVIEIGSNYAKVEGVRFEERISLDDFHAVCSPEPTPQTFIDAQIHHHREQVRRLMGEIRDLCHRLGVPMRQALAAQETASTALSVAHNVDDVRSYKTSLVQAKDDTLPALFAQVKKQHEHMATWMHAELIPAQAELRAARDVTAVIEGKIHTVELYAGLQEELIQVRDGAPADLSARVHLMQRMHYMDEECLARYEAGGMDFKDIGVFDAWIAKDENLSRILPHDRCIVAFRVRRNNKDYGDLDPFIKLRFDRNNKSTFLYIRNGRQLWRMSTSIDFNQSLFPKQEDELLLGDHELWIRGDEHNLRIITRAQRDKMIDQHKALRTHMAQKLWQWHRAGKPKGTWMCLAVSDDLDYCHQAGETYAQTGKPHRWHLDTECEAERYKLLTPQNIYHDDAMARIRQATLEPNRIAVIVQGLLDRSTCLHPHPPWRIWTQEGFASGIELVYDVSRALTPGEAPDFEEYRKQLNRSLKVGCHAIGQCDAWHEHMENLYGDKSWRHEGRHGRGPCKIDRIHRIKRDGSCEFRWMRNRANALWVDHPTRPGYLKATYPEIEVKWLCPSKHLTCVDAYTPGDFRLFYDDPRLRADYLKWAPILLACEDWHHQQRHPKDADTEENDDTEEDDTTDD